MKPTEPIGSIGRLAVLFAAAALSPLATGQTLPDVAPEIVSAWKAVGQDAIVIFRYDGTYYLAQDSATEPGMERGTFTWDKATAAFSATTIVDTNGELGLSHPGGITTLTISGNTMIYTVAGPGGGSFTFSRVVNTASAIVGSWFVPGEKSTVTFLADGTYYNTEEDNGAPAGYDGMERGTYTWVSNVLIATPITDTNGDTGLSSIPSGFTVAISGNTLTATDPGGSTVLQRITTNATPFAKLLGDFHVEKFSNFIQSADAAPSPLNGPGPSDYPFWGEAYVQAYVGASAPTLKIGTRTPVSFSFDPEGQEYLIENDTYTTKAALDAATAYPDGTTYEFKSGSDSATLTFPASVAFPAVPKLLLGSGFWDSGSYHIDANGTLSWTGQNPFDPSKHATLLSIEDVTANPSVDLIKEFVIQGDVTSYDLTGKLTPGHDYWVTIEHLKIGSSTTAGTGVFAGRQGHAFHNTNTSFLLQANADPANFPIINEQPVSRLAEAGDNIILTVAANGWPAPTYQWFKDGVPLPGQTGNSLSLFNFDINNRGAYTVTATNSEGSVTSSTAWLSGPPVVEFVIVGKDVQYVQTAASTSSVVVNPEPVSGHYGGPYGFSANVEGQNMQLLTAPTVTPPGGTPAPFYSTLSLDQWDLPEWSYGPNANNWGELSQAAIDARFPNGIYTFSVSGVSVPLNLTGNAYPNTPHLTLSGGEWVNGKYAMDAANPLTVTTNVFTGYGLHVDDHIGLWINDDGVELFHSTTPATNTASRTIPAHTLPTNQITYVGASFDAIVSKNNALAGAYCAAYYGTSVDVEVHILPKITGQTSSQTVFTGGNLTLQVTATGTPVSNSFTSELAYQWKKDGVDLPGMTSRSFDLLNFAAGNAGTYTCTVSNDVGTATSLPIVISLPDAFAVFVADYGLDPLTTGAPGFDFDKDGVPNLLEYLFGTNPTLPGSNPLPTVTKAPGSSNVVFTYKRKLAAAGVSQVVEHSANLSSSWTPAVHGQSGVTIATSPVDAATEQVTVTIPSTTASRFVRLKATR